MAPARRAPPEHFMDLLLDAVCVVDRDGCFQFVSAAGERIFGYAPEEMVGRPVLDFVHPDDRQRTLGAIHEILGGEPKHHFENRYLRKDGSTAHIMWSARWSEDDEVRIAVARDVTDRKQAEALQNAVYAISDAVNRDHDLPTLFEAIDAIVRDLLRIEDFVIAMKDPDTAEMRFTYPRRPAEGQHGLDDPLLQSLGLRVVEAGVAIRLTPETEGATEEPRPNHLAVPLGSGDTMMGALVVRNGSDEVPYTETDLERLGFVSVPIAAAIERASLQSRLTYMAQHDQLTGLPNRALFMDRLQSALARAHRDGTHLAVLYLDLDDFKNVNDTLGHTAGDQLLQEISRRLTGCVRGADTVGRMGGDEFVVLLDGIEQPGDGETVARKIDAALQVPCELAATILQVRPSIGVAVYPEDGRDTDQLILRADQAMYAAKRALR